MALQQNYYDDEYGKLRKRVQDQYSPDPAAGGGGGQQLSTAPFTQATGDPVRAIGPTEYTPQPKTGYTPPSFTMQPFQKVGSPDGGYTGPEMTTRSQTVYVPPGGYQDNFANGNEQRAGAPIPGATTNSSSLDVPSIVNGWMTSNNPYGHTDANYWIQKILTSKDYASNPQGVIDYFKGRFLENPNSNPHTGSGGGAMTNSGGGQRQLPPGWSIGSDGNPGHYREDGGWQSESWDSVPMTGGGGGQPSQPSYIDNLRNMVMEQIRQLQEHPIQFEYQEPQYLADQKAALTRDIAAAREKVNPEDEVIRTPYLAARDAASRQADEERKQLAERLYAEGAGGTMDTSALNQGIQQSNERVATNLASKRADLVSHEQDLRNQRLQNFVGQAMSAGKEEAQLRTNVLMQQYSQARAQIQGYLQMAMASGDAEAARQLQATQAQLDRDLREQQMAIDAQLRSWQLDNQLLGV